MSKKMGVIDIDLTKPRQSRLELRRSYSAHDVDVLRPVVKLLRRELRDARICLERREADLASDDEASR